MIFPMTDREMLEQLRSLSNEELAAIWQCAPDPQNLTKRERMARDICQKADMPAGAMALQANAAASGLGAPAG